MGIRAKKVTLGYDRKVVLENIHLNVSKGEFISIIGPSGVGKSTLLMAINGGVKIFDGDLVVLDQNLRTVRNSALKNLRSRIGVIFQGFHLVKRLSVLDNIASGMLQKISTYHAAVKYYRHVQYEKIYECMCTVGIEDEALQRCDRLSGGQMQRVAIARALAQEPEIILADEPVSSLDPVSATMVMDTLQRINRQYGITIIANLHQLDYAKRYCSRVIGINGGKIIYDGAPGILSREDIDRIYSGSKNNDVPQIFFPDVCPVAA
jgi:phosphonate transport system ATP-binding protein